MTGMHEIAVRVGQVGDADRIAELLAGGSLRAAEDPSDVAAYQAALQEILATPGSDVLVAERDGEVVAMCQLITFRHIQDSGGRCAEIESMHVDERFRSQGIGGVLLGAAIEAARAAGCYRVQLTSNKTRGDAHRFYLAHGFEASHQGFKLYL
jgi:GNAT superfamily N-acetyltransferase